MRLIRATQIVTMTDMTPKVDCLTVRLATTPEDVTAAQRLRYRVFVQELGGDGAMVDHEAGIEADRFDPYCDHLLLIDPARPEGDAVVGVYRLLRSDQAEAVGGFYTENEYDLTPLKQTGRKLLELGRSCLAPDYRGGTGMFRLWNALAAYVTEHDIEILFGTASFHGTNIDALAPALSVLSSRHLAPPELRVRAIDGHYQPMDLMTVQGQDRVKAMLNTPALIKAYLRLGGFVGDGAFVDHDFNTTDICLILDTARMNAAQRAIYTRGAAL